MRYITNSVTVLGYMNVSCNAIVSDNVHVDVIF